MTSTGASATTGAGASATTGTGTSDSTGVLVLLGAAATSLSFLGPRGPFASAVLLTSDARLRVPLSLRGA